MTLAHFPSCNYLAHRAEIDEAVQRVLHSGHYILGAEVEGFEHELAEYLHVKSVVAVASGTDALLLGLKLHGIGPGDVVITVANTAVATVAAVGLAGASPLFIDVDPITFTMDPSHLEDALRVHGERVKAVIPVHLFGHPADMPRIREIVSQRQAIVLEDCAQALGSTVQGKRVGGWGHSAALSFYPTKNLGAVGDAGAVVPGSSLDVEARALRQYGWRDRYISESRGMNTRMDELQAAVLRVKLRYLDAENGRRVEIANLLNRLLEETPLQTPSVKDGYEHVFHQYVIRTDRRDDLLEHLRRASIPAAIHYPVPIHQQPAYAGKVLVGPGGLATTEKLNQRILSLSIHPHLKDEEVMKIVEVIRLWVGGGTS